jgi:hypothetical protein
VLSNRLQTQLNTPVGVTPRVAFAALWAFPHDLGRMYAFVDVVNGRSRLPLSNDRCAAVSGHACVDTRTSAQAEEEASRRHAGSSLTQAVIHMSFASAAVELPLWGQETTKWRPADGRQSTQGVWIFT